MKPIRITVPRMEVSVFKHTLRFTRSATPDSDYRFPCDADGNVFLDTITAIERHLYGECVKGTVDGEAVSSSGIHREEAKEIIVAQGECWCGTTMSLRYSENVCPGCGHVYNKDGNWLEA